MTRGALICQVGHCIHGCTADTGCCGKEYREHYAERDIQLRAQALVQDAEHLGVVLTIEQQPLQPPRMGHYRTVVTTRKARHAG